MLVKWCYTVCDAGLTLNYDWFNVSYFQIQKAVTAYFSSEQLLPLALHTGRDVDDETGGKSVIYSMSARYTDPLPGSLLGHRLRRWPNIERALDQYIIFSGLCEFPANTRP